MSSGLDKIKAIGAQKIHESTHIYKQHIQGILHESFEGMNEIQLMGFISILEREYDVDLSDLKQKAKEFFKEETPKVVEDQKIFIVPKKRKNLVPFYITLVLAIFLAFVYFKVYPDYISKEVREVDNTAIENAKINISQSNEPQEEIVEVKEEVKIVPKVEEEKVQEPKQEVKSESKKEVKSEPKQEAVAEAKPLVLSTNDEPAKSLETFKILPKSKLWVGYIDLATYKKFQKMSNAELSLDPNKDWLLSLGHGYVDVEINGQVQKFRDRKNIRLLYENGVLTKIDYKTFKNLNKGGKW